MAHEKTTAATAQGYGIPLETWNNLDLHTKRRLYFRFQNGVRELEELTEPATDYAEKASSDYGIPKEIYESLSQEELWTVRSRYQQGYKGSDLLLGIEEGIRLSVSLSAKRMGIDAKRLDQYDKSLRITIARRYKQGKRGEDLFKNLGEGSLARSKDTAEKLGISFEQWDELTREQRNVVRGRFKMGYRNCQDLLEGVKEGLSIALVKSSRDVGIPTRIYAQLSEKERETIRKRHKRGTRGPDLLIHLHGSGQKAIEAAKKYEIDVKVYASLSKPQKLNLAQRYRRGKRGAELLVGLDIPGISGEVDT